jgi:colanic acid/amylovoran biosynthesis glycosyltransferase
MKVLHLWDSYAPGLFDHSYEICRVEAVDTRLVCMHLVVEGQTPDPSISFVRQVDRADAGAGLFSRIRRKCRWIVDQNRFRRVARETVRNFDPDVLHVHYGTTAAILVSAQDVLATPFIVSFYGFDISQGVRTPAIRAAYQRVMKLRPLVHVLCAEAAERAMELGASRERIVDANLPLPVERYPYVGLGEREAFRWLIPARFVEKKGHSVALCAFKRHLEIHPQSRLTCWGYGNPGWLRKEVDELGLGECVTVIDNGSEGPFDSAYLKRLHEHDAVLAPSVRSFRGDDEGGPALTAVLAQVAGKPVIVSDFPGHERSVTDGVEGLVVPQGDVDALAAAMSELSTDRERARAMGKMGRERALHAFDMQTYRNALIGWYQSLAT